MDRFPKETIYYVETDDSFLTFPVDINRELGDEIFYRTTVKRTGVYSSSEFARIMWLYREEFQRLVEKQEEKFISPTSTSTERYIAMRRAQFLCCICEVKGTRMLKEQECRDVMPYGQRRGRQFTDIAEMYIKGYLIHEKAMRFAYNGNRSKAEKYIQKHVVYLAEIWEFLKDKDERGEGFSAVLEGETLQNGAAFQPILDMIKSKIEDSKTAVEIFC